MNVIDGQAGLIVYASLIFYSLTINNILNIIVLLILAGVAISMLAGENGIINKTNSANADNQKAQQEEEEKLIGYENVIEDSLSGDNSKGKEYSFKLNELEEYIKDTGDSAFYFKLSNIWDKVGTDLSENSDYYYQASADTEKYFIFKPDNNELTDVMGITLAIFSIEESNKFGISSYIDGEYLWVKIVNIEGKDCLVESPSDGQMTHEQFMDKYGATEFSFVKVSDYLK